MIGNAIIDSACLISLDRIDKLDLPPKVFHQIFITPAVRTEFGKSVEYAQVIPVKNEGVIYALRTQIDAGEAEAIALAMEKPEAYLTLDDKKARRIARQIGLNVLGTIGVLLKAKSLGKIQKIKPILDQLNAVGFRIGASLYTNALRLSGEQEAVG